MPLETNKPITANKIKTLLNYTSSPRLLEIGCNDGSDTQKILEEFCDFPNLRMYCFEPDPRAIPQFNARINDKRCKLFELALSNTCGSVDFHQSSGTCEDSYKVDWDLSGSLNKPTGHLERHDWVKFNKKIKVKSLPLDALISDFVTRIDFIWMDVQGAEAKVIEGGRRTLSRTRFIYAEFNDYEKPLYEGAMNLEETMAMLGPGWELMIIHEKQNLLAVNHKCQV